MRETRGLSTVHAPSVVTVVGASDDPDKIGGRPIHFMKTHGFRGRIVPVNPRRDTVQGLAAVATIAEIEPTPDVAIIAVPGQAAVDAVCECARAGTDVAIVISSGFGEGSDPGDRAQLVEMQTAAAASGMRLIGPNAQGLANFANGTILTFSTLVRDVPAADGPIAVVSQSGAMSSLPYALLRERGFGVRYMHATGNDADVTVGELAGLCAEDPEIRLLILYLENLANAQDLASAAAIAARRGVPVLAVVGGRSEAGQAAASSHTGALASERRVVDAFLEKLGFWVASSVAEAVDMAPLYLRGWSPKGRRLGVISNSGAICVLAADAASDVALPLAELSSTVTERLSAILPDFASVANPVDLTAALLTDGSLVGASLTALSEDTNVDAMFLGIPVAGSGYDVERFAKDAGAVAATCQLPFVTAFPMKTVRDAFTEQGVVTFDDERRAVTALSNYLSHLERVERAAPQSWLELMESLPESSGDGRVLDEVESLRRLNDVGIQPVKHRMVEPDAVDGALLNELGISKAVVKGVSEAVTHKSELGLVRLGVTDGRELESAAADIVSNATSGGVPLRGIIVAEQVSAYREMLVGAHRDPVFGPVVMVGAGGRYVEAIPDVALVLPPFDADGVRAALDRLRIRPLLDGVRGEPPIDLDPLINVVMGVARLISDSAAGVESIDINPVLVDEHQAVAADAVVIESGGHR